MVLYYVGPLSSVGNALMLGLVSFTGLGFNSLCRT